MKDKNLLDLIDSIKKQANSIIREQGDTLKYLRVPVKYQSKIRKQIKEMKSMCDYILDDIKKGGY